MKVVAGLGNPGREYDHTPHNVGFAVVDRLAEQFTVKFKNSLRFKAETARVTVDGSPVLLAKPRTYMNLSGSAVSGLLKYHKATAQDLLVVVDDADLPLGRLRIRAGGSSGGHRGLESIIGCLGTGEFARIRIGVGRENEESGGRDLVRHVLKPLKGDDLRQLEAVAEVAGEAVLACLRDNVEKAMNAFNHRVISA